MLDRAQVVRKLEEVAHDIFFDNTTAHAHIKALWRDLCSDPYAEQKIRAVSPAAIVSWHGKLDGVYDIIPVHSNYRIIAIDGSQIYPDRHCGFACYVINIGHVIVRYGFADKKPVELYSIPYVFSGYDNQEVLDLSAELVNCKRQEFEFQRGVLCASLEREKNGIVGEQMHAGDPLLLFDGSLIFWHLEAIDISFKEAFFSRYIRCLLDLYEKRIVMASYISFPKSRELVTVLRAYAEYVGIKDEAVMQALERITDGTLARFNLTHGQRTNLFENHSRISSQYPEMLKPWFFYLHVGDEIGRVEIPAWIARDEALVRYVAELIYDQCQKGGGYPIALAEAHEQAVVKGADRDFFYHMLGKMGMARNRGMVISQKLYKKQNVGV